MNPIVAKLKFVFAPSSSREVRIQDVSEGEASALELIRMYRLSLARCTQVCEDAAKGSLEMRLLNVGECGDFSPLMHGINHLLDMTDAFMRESFAALEHAGQGKFYRRVLLRGMLGSFRNASNLINQATEQMAQNAGKLRESEQRRLALADQFESSVKKVVSAFSASADQVKHTAAQLSEAAGESAETEVATWGVSDPGAKDAAKVQHLNGVVATLGVASQKIGGVVTLISEIAAQTNLLALNATIESARVREAGKGFAVVASEVKTLARQTAQATGDISREIAGMRGAAARTAELVGSMNSTIHAMSQFSDQLSGHAEELAASVETFLQTIRS